MTTKRRFFKPEVSGVGKSEKERYLNLACVAYAKQANTGRASRKTNCHTILRKFTGSTVKREKLM